MDQILNTKLALQRKYKIGEVLDYCQEYLNNLNDLMKILTPVAVRASLLMTLSIKMNTVIKCYDFSVTFIENILLGMSELVKVETKVNTLAGAFILSLKTICHMNFFHLGFFNFKFFSF